MLLVLPIYNFPSMQTPLMTKRIEVELILYAACLKFSGLPVHSYRHQGIVLQVGKLRQSAGSDAAGCGEDAGTLSHR